jgi:hypothetical protein
VTHTYNPSSGVDDWEDDDLRLAGGNNESPILTNEKLGIVVHTCHPSYRGSINRITVQASPGIKVSLRLKNR